MTATRGYTLTDLETAIMWELGQVTGTTVSFSKFPQSQIRQKLNDRQNQFVYHTHCLKRSAIIRAKANYRLYRLPINCMDSGLLSVKYYDTATTYQEMEIVDQEYQNDQDEGYMTGSSSTPQRCWQGYSDGNTPVIEVYPAPETSGTAYSAGTGYALGSILPTATANITGTATSGSDATLVVTAGTFDVQGLVAGMPVLNVTDGSYSFISTIAATTITLSPALTGGIANVFAIGDTYKILAGEYMAYIDWAKDDQYIFSANPGALGHITIPANSFFIQYLPYPVEFPASGSGTTYPEIPKLYHFDGLAMGVVADFLRSFHETSKQFQRAEFYENKWKEAVLQARETKTVRPFNTKGVQMRPQF